MARKLKTAWTGLKNLLLTFSDPRAQDLLTLEETLKSITQAHQDAMTATEQRAQEFSDQLSELSKQGKNDRAMLQSVLSQVHGKLDSLEVHLNGLDDRILELETRQIAVVNQTGEQLRAIQEIHRQDALVLLRRLQDFAPAERIRLETEHPIAIDSDDHLVPRGTRNDNTRYPRFARRCEQVFQRRLRFLDLGCAGGGLVLDFLMRGHLAVGLEGSDYSLKFQRAEWRMIPEFLHTADIVHPFRLLNTTSDDPVKFDVISCWEVLEHIPESDLPALFQNIRNHLASDGVFVASVATFEDADVEKNARWHVTVQPKEWWQNVLMENGFEVVVGLFEPVDFPRGSGNGPNDWSVIDNPKLGFHLTAKFRA